MNISAMRVTHLAFIYIFFIGYINSYAQKINFKKDGISYCIQDRSAILIKKTESNASQENIVIPEHVEYQGKQYAVTQIGSKAFCDCVSLISVKIPSTVKLIKDWAFSGCTQLTSVEIPEEIEYIDATAFYGCTTLPQTDGLRYAGRFLVCVADSLKEEYTIQPGTRWIGANALSYLTSVRSVNIPSSVEVIGCFAFSCCPNLEKVKLPQHLSCIEHFAFSSCTNLSEIMQLTSVEEAGKFIFRGCEKETMLEEFINKIAQKRLPYN